jgi:ATP-dependent Clp protease ATP-binding subunit ClpA
MASPDRPADDIFHPGGGVRLDLLTEEAGAALREAVHFAKQTRWESLRSPHVFMGLLAGRDPGVANWARRLGADRGQLLEQFQEFFHQEHGDPEALLALHREFLSDNVLRLLREAHLRASAHGRTTVTPMDLLITLLTAANSIVAHCFEQLGGVTAAKLTELAVMAEQDTRSA